MTTFTRFKNAGLESGRVALEGMEALLPTPTPQTCAGEGFKRRQDLSKPSLELACLLAVSEEEIRFCSLFQDSSKLAPTSGVTDGFCPAVKQNRWDKNGSRARSGCCGRLAR